jgi:hypothetical protein
LSDPPSDDLHVALATSRQPPLYDIVKGGVRLPESVDE